MLLNSVIFRPKVAFNHLLDQLLVWFNIHESSRFFRQLSELLRLERTRLKEDGVGVLYEVSL